MKLLSPQIQPISWGAHWAGSRLTHLAAQAGTPEAPCAVVRARRDRRVRSEDCIVVVVVVFFLSLVVCLMMG